MTDGPVQRILITGATGYLGGRLAQYLAQNPNYDLILGSRHYYAAAAESRIRRVLLNFQSLSMLSVACTGVDTILHLSGANAQSCVDDPVGALESNGVATARLVDAAIASGVRRLIYVSTAHVYGSPLSGVVTESSCARGLNPYATSHRAGEDAVLFARAQQKIDGVVVRLSNAFGAPANVTTNCWRLLVPDLCRQASENGRLVLTSSGLQRRDFVTMADACAALDHLIRIESTGEGIFNVGGEWGPTVFEMAERVAGVAQAMFGRAVPVRSAAEISFVRVEDLEFRIDALRNTGFVPRRDVDAEIAATLEFCLSNRWTMAKR